MPTEDRSSSAFPKRIAYFLNTFVYVRVCGERWAQLPMQKFEYSTFATREEEDALVLITQVQITGCE